MSLVTRVSVAFLVALALALVGSPRACTISPAAPAARARPGAGGDARPLPGTRLSSRAAASRGLSTTTRGGGSRRHRAWAADDPRRPRPRPPRRGRRDDDQGSRRPAMAGARAATRRRAAAAVAGRPRPAAKNIGQGRRGVTNTTGRAGRAASARPRVLAAWASLEPVESEIRSLAATLPLLSLVLWALAAGIGRHFGRRALAPLTLMAESARTMPFDDCRLPSPGTRDELDDFARSFNGLLDRLHVALERQKQFTGQASHQLRTPLAALIAAIDVARRRPRTGRRA